MNKVNEQDKNNMLKGLLGEGESYQAKAYGVIMAGIKTYTKLGVLSLFIGSLAGAMGALSNAYCYVGATEKNLNFAIINSFNPSKIKEQLSIPLDSLNKVKVKKSFIPGRYIIKLRFEKSGMKLVLMNNTWGTDLVGQKEGMLQICDLLKNLQR